MESDIPETTRSCTKPPAAHTRGPRLGTLTAIAGRDVGAFVVIPPWGIVVGRDRACDFCVGGEAISRRHFRILAQDGQYDVEDLGSKNGTWVGDARVHGRMRLRPGMRLRTGNIVFRFALQDEIERESSERLLEMCVRDPLTGTYNRRYFTERLGVEQAFAARQDAPLSLLLIDVDGLKPINDHFGHLAGDTVLNAVGAALRAGTRAEDVVARIGGDEFAVLVRVSGEGARTLAERLRASIEALQVHSGGEELPVRVSIGVAALEAVSASRDHDLMAAADAALYASKRGGRNRVEGIHANPRTDPSDAEQPDRDASRRPTRAED